MSKFTHQIVNALNGDLLINSTSPDCDYIMSLRLNEELPISSLNNIIADAESVMKNKGKLEDLLGINIENAEKQKRRVKYE